MLDKGRKTLVYITCQTRCNIQKKRFRNDHKLQYTGCLKKLDIICVKLDSKSIERMNDKIFGLTF